MSDIPETSLRYRTEGNPAPGALIKVQGFLNTWSEELAIEDFDTPQAMEQWLRAAALWDGVAPVTIVDHQRIQSIRHQIRQSVLHPDQMAQLQASQSKLSFKMAFAEAGEPTLQPSGCGSDLVLGRLMAVIYNSMIDGTWSRFKCCALASCGWAFYDSTRSRTKRWCSMRTCGSRHKAREYYKRRR